MKSSVFEAYSADELLTHLKAKEDYIVIKGAYCEKVYELMKTHLSETETMGFELGSGGVITILANIINNLRDFIKNDQEVDKTTKLIEKKLNIYKVHSLAKNEIVLKLKQLDY